MSNEATVKNGSTSNATTTIIPLSPCKISQWSGVGKSIEKSYANLNFK